MKSAAKSATKSAMKTRAANRAMEQTTRWRRATRALALFVPLALSACGGDAPPEPQEAPKAAAQKGPAKAAGTKAEPDSGTWAFDELEAGSGPGNGWTIYETGGAGKPATWSVQVSPDAPTPPKAFGVTKTENAGQTYNVAAAPNLWAENVSLSVSVRAERGEEDQGGGPVWRLIDANHYYVCRINPLEDNFRVYKVVGGVRTELASADVATEPGRWYAIRVGMVGKKIHCFLDGKKLLEVEDDALRRAGRVGLWTKADAVTWFDSLTAMKL
jgi:hypothetical protein